MIAFIRGTVYHLAESSAIIDTGALGYEVYMTVRDLSRLSVGQEVFLHTWFQVREDAMTLYGFPSRDDLEVFGLLLGVNGIGPKAALGVLGALTANDLRFAVLADDVKAISAAPGIGKKTAQKLILELKDKLKLQDAFEGKLAEREAELSGAALPEGGGQLLEAIEALVALGYSPSEANRAVRRVPDGESMDVEALLKAALTQL